MIYILEGINGVGKSEVAKAIQDTHPDTVIWRAFRPDPDIHLDHTDDVTGQMLIDAGVPLNTFVDDLYVADALRALRPQHHVVLDRSMPSSVAYALLKGEPWAKTHLDWVLAYWEQTMAQIGGAFVTYLRADYPTSKRRCLGRWHPNKAEWNKLRQAFERFIQRTSLPVRVIQTDDITVESIAARVCQQ